MCYEVIFVVISKGHVMTQILSLTFVCYDMLPDVCDLKAKQPGGDVGEEAGGPERHPGE